jgi:hypothetical protein
MSNIQNPFNNVGNSLPPQPFGSVVNQLKNNENVLIETAGLDAYTFLDVGQELNAWNRLQQVQNSAVPPNRTNEFNIDTSNKFYPRLTPLFFQGDAQNTSLLNNPADRIQNLDLSSQRTYIKPFYTTNEQFGSVLPIEVNNSMLPLGPVYVKKIVLPSNNIN